MMSTNPKERSAWLPSTSTMIFFVLLLLISLMYIFRKHDPWYLASCPLSEADPSYRDRLQSGLDPNFRVSGTGQQEMDLVIWHASNGKCENSVSEYLMAKRDFGGTLDAGDLERATWLYQSGEIDQAAFELAQQIAGAKPTPSN